MMTIPNDSELVAETNELVAERRVREFSDEDLTAFFGHKSQWYLGMYKWAEARKVESGKRSVDYAFSWPAFLAVYAWFFYRKMYLVGCGIMLIPILLVAMAGSTTPGFGIVLSFIIGQQANGLYIAKAKDRIRKADKLGLEGPQRLAYLRRAGDVSVAGGFVGATIFVVIFAFAFYAATQKAHTAAITNHH